MKKWFFLPILLTFVVSVHADALIDHPAHLQVIPTDFEEAFEDLQNEVVGRGLGIDYIGNVDDMLNRTASTVASSLNQSDLSSPYIAAKYFQFCSSQLTHQATQANPANIAMCPFLLFAYETKDKPGQTVIGYRPPTMADDKSSQALKVEIEAYLYGLLEAVAEGY